MLFDWPLPTSDTPFTYSLNDVAHGYGELSPCHFTVRRLCTTLPLATRHYSFISQRCQFAPHFEMPGGRFATVDTQLHHRDISVRIHLNQHAPRAVVKAPGSLSSVTGIGANSSTRRCASAGEPGAGNAYRTAPAGSHQSHESWAASPSRSLLFHG